jgi:ABC-type Zn uptake system ZnuABC Zn-binding protein ZnuA
MDKNKINTIEMIRNIRDENAKRLAGKSHVERIAFYREQAKKLEKKLPVLLSELAMASSGKGDYSKDRHVWLDNQNLDTVAKRIREKRATYKKKK